MSQPKMQKRMREKAQAERAAAKRQRRAERSSGAGADDVEAAADAEPAESQEQVLAQLAELHARFADEELDFDTFAEAKAELLARLHV